jgi:hypothetical protein
VGKCLWRKVLHCLEGKRTRSVWEEQDSFMIVRSGEEEWVLTSLKSFGLREFDDFFMFIIKEIGFPNSQSPKLIWAISKWRTHVSGSRMV